MDNNDRYNDYVHKLFPFSGTSEYIDREILPLRCIPNRDDPRRERSLTKVLDIQFSNAEKPLMIVHEASTLSDKYQQILQHIVIPSRRSAPLVDTAHMPNCRDPRRFRACKRRGFVLSKIGPPNLVENPEVPAEEETCPVLTIDLTDWPKSTNSYIELIPHECNILRATEFAFKSGYSEQLVASDNENVSDVIDFIDDDLMQISGYDAGDSTKPMLAIGDCMFDVETSAKSFLGDDELVPVVKREPTPERPVPSLNESNIDVIELSDDDDDEEEDRKCVVKRERSSSVECISAKPLPVPEVVILDSDDDDDDDVTAAVEQLVVSTTELTENSQITNSLGSEQESACDAQQEPLLDVINCSSLGEFSETLESTKDDDAGVDIPIALCAEINEAQTTPTTDADNVLANTDESDHATEVDSEPCRDDKTDKRRRRRISIVTSEAFAAQKKLLIDVISNSNNDATADEDCVNPSRGDEYGARPPSQEKTSLSPMNERLQRVISEMTCAKYLDRSIFSNSCITEQIAASSEKRKREESPERTPSDETLAVAVKKLRYFNVNADAIDEVVDSAIRPTVPDNHRPAPAASTAITLYQNKSPCLPTTNCTVPVISANIFNLYQALLSNLINYVEKYNIVHSTIEFMLRHYGGLSVVTAIQVVNETFWRNRYNRWNNNDWNGSVNRESTDLFINKSAIALLPEDHQVEKQVDPKSFLKYPVLKSNKLPIKSYDNLDRYNSYSEAKKIKKRHSLPTAVVPQHKSYAQRVRSNSWDSWNDDTNNLSLKLKLTRDQSNKQNWIASNSQEYSGSSSSHHLEKAVVKSNYFAEKHNTLLTNIQNTKEKTSYHSTIDVTKIKSCSDKVVPELENDDYVGEPVIKNNFIEKKNLESNVSPYLQGKIKRHPNEAIGKEEHSYFISKRAKICDNSIKIEVNANINIHLNPKIKQDKPSLDLSKSFNGLLKNLPKNCNNNISNSKISLSCVSNGEKHGVDHHSNIEKDVSKEQVISSPERYNSKCSSKKRRRSQEMAEERRRKIGRSSREAFNENHLSRDDGYDSRDSYENDVKTSLNKDSVNPEIKLVLNITEHYIENTTNNSKQHVEDAVKNSHENSKHLEESSPILPQVSEKDIQLEKPSHISQTSEKDIEDSESNTNSITVSARTKEFLDKCVREAESGVSSENISSSEKAISEKNSPVLTTTTSSEVSIPDSTFINSSLSSNNDVEDIKNNSIEEGNLEEGDFDFQVDNNSVCSYDSFTISDSVESQDLNNSNCITIHSFEENENGNTESRKQCVLVSNSCETTIKGKNDHCSNKAPEYLNLVHITLKNSSNSNEETTAADSSNDNIEKTNVGEKIVDSTNSNTPENEVSTSNILSPNPSIPIIHINDECVNNNNDTSSSDKNTLMSNNDITESSSSYLIVKLPKRNFCDDLKNPIILKEYNLIVKESELEETKTYESTDNLSNEPFPDALNAIQTFFEMVNLEILACEKIAKNKSTTNQPEISREEYKKCNIHYIDIDSENDNSLVNLKVSNSLDTSKASNTFKVRNINELLEKKAIPKCQNSVEQRVGDVQVMPSANTSHSTDSANSSYSTNSVKPEDDIRYRAISKSVYSSFNYIISNMNTSNANNQISKNILSNKSSLQSNSQICIRLASNIFSSEFSTSNLPTIYSMSSPPIDSLKILLPPCVKTDTGLLKYKAELLDMLISSLNHIEKHFSQEFEKYSNDLLNYNKLTVKTWHFHYIILTIIQCISRLIFCTDGENQYRILEIIEKTTGIEKLKVIRLKQIISLYLKLEGQGLCLTNIFLFNPIYTEIRNNNSDVKMTTSQEDTLITQINFYRSKQGLKGIENISQKLVT